MINQLKAIKRKLQKRGEIRRAYQNDCAEYSRWQYRNAAVKTQNALEAKILRQTHILEKGMSLSHPRERFGVQKACELLDFIDEFESLGYSVRESTPVTNAIGILDAYIAFHAERNFTPKEVVERFEKLKGCLPETNQPYGTVQIKRTDMEKEIHGEFPDFFRSRHSVRQFSDRPISREVIEEVVKLAMHAPSACNRQSCKVYFYSDRETNRKLGELIAGNTGFEDEAGHYLVVTSDMSAFYDAFERNQVYVDGGIFAMALSESLHYHGIANCILQNGEYAERNARFKAICGNIPENEKIILFIAIGYYKDEFSYATSHRKKLHEVLKLS